nr:MAG TPA: hypothetical protein [Crassvirales sp.]
MTLLCPIANLVLEHMLNLMLCLILYLIMFLIINLAHPIIGVYTETTYSFMFD